MTFKTMWQSDMNNVILNTLEFAEPITYKSTTLGDLTVNAVIDRNRLDPFEGGRTVKRDCEIFISKESVEGVSTVDVQDDQVVFPEVLGGSDVTWRVVEIMAHDYGLWRLMVRK